MEQYFRRPEKIGWANQWELGRKVLEWRPIFLRSRGDNANRAAYR